MLPQSLSTSDSTQESGEFKSKHVLAESEDSIHNFFCAGDVELSTLYRQVWQRYINYTLVMHHSR